MEITRIDACGLACPKPVLLTRDQIDKNNPDVMEVIVDNEAAVLNVTRFLSTRGYMTRKVPENGKVKIIARRSQDKREEPAGQEEITCEVPAGRKVLVMITTDRIGVGDDELGRKLMANFLATLPEMGSDLWRIICVNSGVRLAVKDSMGLEHLKKLEDSGVSVLVCGTCLEHYGLSGQKEAGTTTNMLDIVTSLQLADKVINF